MFDADRWNRLQSGEACPHCHELLPQVASKPGFVARSPAGPVLLQDDAAFRGYCMLIYHRHATELFQLTAAEQRTFHAATTALARAIWGVCGPAKLNYVILGNEVPHLHVHVIPRYPDDGWWGRPTWLRPAAEKRALPPADFAALSAQLAAALAEELAYGAE